MEELQCPYCNELQEPDNEEGYDQDVAYQQECSHCLQNFLYTVSYMIVFSENVAPCLNGKPHDWKPIFGAPKEHFIGKYHCGYGCDAEEKREGEKAIQEWHETINKYLGK